jgi:hypothetical protein
MYFNAARRLLASIRILIAYASHPDHPETQARGGASSSGPLRSWLLPVCCPSCGSRKTPARRKRPARPVTRALWGWR